MIVYTMPKSRIMSAGTVGTSKRIRVNGPEGGGDALQGLPPICNMRSPLVPYVRTRADGDNRNVVFCVNQLSGGVGAKRGQFGPGNRAGVGQTGGCSNLKPWWFNNPAIRAAFLTVGGFVASDATYNPASDPQVFAVFIGNSETVKTDHVASNPNYVPGSPEWLFDELEPTTGSSNVNDAIKLLNSMKLQFYVNGKLEPHVVGIVGKKALPVLFDAGYGISFLLADDLAPIAFGNFFTFFATNFSRGFNMGFTIPSKIVSLDAQAGLEASGSDTGEEVESSNTGSEVLNAIASTGWATDLTSWL